MQNPLNEHELTGEIKKGSLSGFRILYDGYASILCKIIWITVKDDLLTERLLEETFLAIRYNLDEFQGQNLSFKLWIAGIAKQMALREIKKALPEIIIVNLPCKQHPDIKFSF